MIKKCSFGGCCEGEVVDGDVGWEGGASRLDSAAEVRMSLLSSEKR